MNDQERLDWIHDQPCMCCVDESIERYGTERELLEAVNRSLEEA